jgi:hypothetical protein
VLSGRGLCEELIIRPEESYRSWRVVVCDLETSKEEAKSPLKGCEYKPTKGCEAEREKKNETSGTLDTVYFGSDRFRHCVRLSIWQVFTS